MASTFIVYILLILIILLLVMAADRIKIAPPIILVLGGLLLSLVPRLAEISIDPDLVFVIFLPPLLYEAAWYTSWKELWRWRRVISSFACLIVILTSLIVAVVSSTVLPGWTMALGFLLGGIVSPPDAVSATSILQRIKVPRRVSAIIEGESLLNDASSLIIFRYALIAVDTGHFIFHQAAFSFVLVIVMGIATGVAIGMLYYAVHKWLPTNPNIDIVLTLTSPYIMYIVAESFHFSGVLAVVSGSLFLSARSHIFLSHRSRLRGANVWTTIGFVLNGLIFMLIGLELPSIIRQLGTVSLQAAIGYGVLITALLTITRILSTLGASVFTMFISRYITTADNRPGWRGPVIIGWAGMRGVVSLAAALSIPVHLPDGTPFPQRNLILFITFVVIVLTLVVQGLSLPWVIRKINMEDPDYQESPEEHDRQISDRLAGFSLSYLRQQQAPPGNKLLQQLIARYTNDLSTTEYVHKEEEKEYKRIYGGLLEKQRLFLAELNKEATTDENLIRKYQMLVDLEQEKLWSRYDME